MKQFMNYLCHWITYIQINWAMRLALVIFPLFYIQSIWLNMLRWNRRCVYVCVFVYVCVCVCVCVTALQPKRMDGFWWNFLQMIWQIFARSIFLGFWNFESGDVMAAILQVFSGALSRSQFLSDLLQNWTWCRITSPSICHLKSAKSVGNFRFYEEPRVRTRAVHDIWRSGVHPYLGHFFRLFLCGHICLTRTCW